MKQRGRDSASALAIATPLQTIQRPDAPYDLTDEQATEWWAVVNRMPADWFPRETHALLAAYCRHVVAGNHIAQLVAAAEKAEPFDVEAYERLLKMQEREGRALSSLATRMRISQQSTYDIQKAKPPSRVSKAPWSYGKATDAG